MPAETDRADTFHALHAGAEILLLPNAWDAGSARVIEQAGARAIATTSAGVAWAKGYPDGDALPVERLLATVEEIVRVVQVPVTADIEGGYADDPRAVGELIAALVDAGAVGINIEDGAGAPELLCRKIAAARAAADRAGVRLFVNARADVFLRGLAVGEAAVEETVRRAGLYVAAGCDGVFVPGPSDLGVISRLAAAIDRPLNMLARPGLPVAAELHAAGVRRLSVGSAISQATLSLAGRLAAGFLESGDVGPLVGSGMSYPQLNGLFAAP